MSCFQVGTNEPLKVFFSLNNMVKPRNKDNQVEIELTKEGAAHV